MTPEVAGTTRLLAVLGWPVAHSLSPTIHNAALAASDRDAVYVALPVPPDDLAGVVAALRAVDAVGVNVTVPHKQAVMEACARVSDEARAIGAVNTLVPVEDGWEGDNTDAVGLQRALEPLATSPDRAVLLGTGGAARAGAVALARLGAEVSVVGRRPDAAAELAGLAREHGGAEAAAVDLADDHAVRDVVAAADVVVNATPLGMGGESLPGPFHQVASGQVAYDMVYRPAVTPFLAAASRAGAVAENGLGMLVGQAAAAWERWFGVAPDTEVMRTAARAALGEV